MFTGIIQSKGKIERIEAIGGDKRFTINVGSLDMAGVELGASIAVNGVCLTAVAFTDNGFIADLSQETLSLTSLGFLLEGSEVNLEKSLTPTTALGGHLVTGHVDALGEILVIAPDARATRFTIKAPERLAKYIAKKGSICVDGTSLTVNEVNGQCFELAIIPHTLQETIFASYQVGSQVNLEVDIIARYVERMTQFENLS